MKKVKLPNRQPAAFTLLELILVILIISVVAGLSSPMFRRTFVDMQLAESCSDLTSLLNYARQSAIFNRSEYRVKLNIPGKKAWIEPKAGRIYSLPTGINIESSKDYITFYPDGRSSAIAIRISTSSRAYVITAEKSGRFVNIEKQ